MSKIKHPETGLIGTRIKDVGNPWLDAGIVPFSTLKYNIEHLSYLDQVDANNNYSELKAKLAFKFTF